MSTLESEIEKKIRLYVTSTGGRFHKLNANYDPGIPDRLAVYPCSAPIYFELKQENGALSNKQEFRINKLKEQGYRAHVVRDLIAFKGILLNYSDIQAFIQKYNVKCQKSKKTSKTGYKIFT